MAKEDDQKTVLKDFLEEHAEINQPDFLAETAERGIDASVAPLLQIHQYLERFAASYPSEPGSPEVDFSLAEFGSISALTERDFQVHQAFSDAGSEVSIKFRLTREHPAKIEYPLFVDEHDVPTLLRRDGVIVLSSRVQVSPDNQSMLSMDIAGDIPVSLSFRALLGSKSLLLTIRNVGTIGRRSYQITPVQVNAQFFIVLDDFLRFQNQDFLKLLIPHKSTKAVVSAPPKAEQTLQADPVSANILTFDLSQRPRQKVMTLMYQGKESTFQETNPVCRIGRRMPADVQVRSRFVSREHATVILDKKQFTLRDHSSNGTYICPEGKPTYMIHHASQKLSGKGVISLGEEISANHPDLIYYDIE